MSDARTPSFLAAFLARFSNVRQYHGTKAALCDVVDRVANKVCGLCVSHLFAFDVRRMTAPDTSALGITCRFLTPDEIRRFAADPMNDLTPAMADRAAAGRNLCFGVLFGQQLAGYGWCALGSIEAEHTGGIPLSYPGHIGYMYKGFTNPAFRGFGLNGIRVALAARALADRGVRQLICLVDWTNWASIQSCRRGGCIEFGIAVTWQFFGRRWWFFPPDGARQLGVRFGDDAQWDAGHVYSDSATAAA